MIKNWISKNSIISPILTYYSVAMILLIPVLAFAWATDDRLVMGINAWIKPLKFTLSGLLYALTLLALPRYLSPTPRRTKLVLDISGMMLAIEMVLIYVQAFRARPSHFNAETLEDLLIFNAMAIGISVFWAMNLVLMIWFMRQKTGDDLLKRGVIWGFISALSGMLVGFLMSIPSEMQLAALQSGQQIALMGSHTVGAPDGGTGLPFLNWSITFGDLRVAHFIGIHAIQILPLFAIWMSERELMARIEAMRKINLAGIGYLALFSLSVWQALKQESITQPSTETLWILGLWLVGIMFTWWFIGQKTPRLQVQNNKNHTHTFIQ
ncbi:MAG TPA: hypothetical protein DIW24_02245 [Bacteroidetes bacterium]|nr:hypothetical protein [Bacteroidota bacterium]HRR08258.1 hypothetical protein [Rhodothermales bacterium]